MRCMECRWGLLLLAVVMAGCETDQPLQGGQRTVELRVTAPGGAIDGYDVWDLFRDNDLDQLPDDVDGDGDPDVTLWCGDRRSPAAGFQAASIPWYFTIEISVTRAGETTREVLTSNSAFLPPAETDHVTGNLTPYDSQVFLDNLQATPPGFSNPFPVTGQPNNPVCPPGPCTFRFMNSRVLTTANLDLILSDTNVLHDFDPGTYDGVCPGVYLGPPRIDGDPQPYTLTLNKGDTVHVVLRRFDIVPPGIEDSPEQLIVQSPSVASSLFVDGVSIGEGNKEASSSEPGSGFTFSYTAN